MGAVKIVRDRRVVCRGMAEHVFGKRCAGIFGNAPAAPFHLFDDRGIAIRIGYHHLVPVILGRGAEHGRSADIDLFDRFVESYTLARHRLFEGIQIHDDHVDGVDTQITDLPIVFRFPGIASNAPCTFG